VIVDATTTSVLTFGALTGFPDVSCSDGAVALTLYSGPGLVAFIFSWPVIPPPTAVIVNSPIAVGALRYAVATPVVVLATAVVVTSVPAVVANEIDVPGELMIVTPEESTILAVIFTMVIPSAGTELGKAVSERLNGAPATTTSNPCVALTVLTAPGIESVTVMVTFPPGGTIAGAVHVNVPVPAPVATNGTAIAPSKPFVDDADVTVTPPAIESALLPLESTSVTVTVVVVLI
jgi:hypothetical protein